MTCNTHSSHDHKHQDGCGHQAVKHGDHTDYLHDGHLHHVHGDHVDEHSLCESDCNTTACTPQHASCGHDSSHSHGSGCGHDAIPHGDHVDYLVDGHLHSPCQGHCDNHGAVTVS